MIESIRRYVSSWVVKGLFLVLVLSFVLWGVADVFRPGARQEWAAKVDGTEIPAEAFAREYQMQARRLRSEAGTPIAADDLRRSGLPQMVIDRMIYTRLLDTAADRLKLMVAPDAVTQAIAGDRRFQNAAGQFDPQIFALILRDAGLNESQYLALQQGDVRRGQILASIGEAVTAPNAVRDTLARHFREQRTAQYARLPLPSAADVGSPDMTQLRAFFDDNPGLFTAPEYRSVAAIVLDAAALGKTIAVSQQDLEAAFAARASEFNEPERRSFQQLIFADAASARDAHSRLIGGADFAKVGLDMLSQDPANLTLSDITRDALPAALGAAVFSQPAGVASAPVETPLGWHIVKVTAIKPGTQRTLDAVRDRLTATLRTERATEALVDIGNELDDALGRGLRLEDAARELNLEVRTFPAVDPDGRDRGGQPIAGLPPRFVATAFSTERGSESVLTEGDASTLFVLRVDDVAPAAIKPFDSVQAEVTRAWQANRRIELARQRAEGLAARVRSDSDLASAAAAEHLTLLTTPALSRATLNTHPEVPRPVAEAIFAAGPERTFVARDADAFYVGRLVAVSEPTAAALEADSRALKEQLAQTLAADVVGQFLSALRREHDVRIDAAALDRSL